MAEMEAHVTGPKMTPERLEWLRTNADHYHNEGEILELLAHIDALEARIRELEEHRAAEAWGTKDRGQW
jgi:hypothetical protein